MHYDSIDHCSESPSTEDNESGGPSAFQMVVISDLDQNSTIKDQKIAALRHLHVKGGSYISLPHGAQAANEFYNPVLLPALFPTLYPFGVGGYENPRQQVKLSLQHQVKHNLNMRDCRFQEHPSFIFTMFNMIQWRTALLHTSLKVKRDSFVRSAENFASISPMTVHAITE